MQYKVRDVVDKQFKLRSVYLFTQVVYVFIDS